MSAVIRARRAIATCHLDGAEAASARETNAVFTGPICSSTDNACSLPWLAASATGRATFGRL